MSTKERILEEALTLFSEQGYDGTGIDEIAAHVGIKVYIYAFQEQGRNS